MKNKWKTNKKNLKDKWRVDISNQISSNFWVVGAGRGREQNTLLHNLRTSSALLTSHVKNVVKKVLKKNDLTDVLLSKWAWPPTKITNKAYAAKLTIRGFALDLTLSTFPSFWLGGPTHLHEMEAMKNETYYFIES